MKLKADWVTYLHDLRRREIEMIFKKCPEKCFVQGLELGAGDGFQSKLLARYAQYLLSTDYNARRLLEESNTNIEYKLCDVEDIDQCCTSDTYDLIFSSNLMEHVQRRQEVFGKIARLLKDDGVTIHVMPSCFLKVCWVGLFHFNLFIEFLEVITKPGGFKKIFHKVFKRPEGKRSSENFELHTNNPKSPPRTVVQRFIWPSRHGEYASHWQEFLAYRKKNWINLMESEGLEVIQALKMPVSSGYGFGFNGIRWILEKFGLCSSYAYIAFKNGRNSPYRGFWEKKLDEKDF